jgi:carbohydrate-selective porin OprB
MGRYDAAISMARVSGGVPNIVADDAPGRAKGGLALNGELPLADDGATGLFARLGWNDGRNESFVFTEVDRHASAGAQFSGRRWHREQDLFGIAGVIDGLSGPHRNYLAAGGRGFLLGDGALRYGAESLGEAYYRLQLGSYVAVSPDLMGIVHPGYNRDRGPASVLSIRVRIAD